jgi:hypothetical protein
MLSLVLMSAFSVLPKPPIAPPTVDDRSRPPVVTVSRSVNPIKDADEHLRDYEQDPFALAMQRPSQVKMERIPQPQSQKSCACNERCICGCNEGLPCKCQHTTSYPEIPDNSNQPPMPLPSTHTLGGIPYSYRPVFAPVQSFGNFAPMASGGRNC